MPLFEIQESALEPVASTTFEALGLRERDDLQRLIRTHLDVIAPHCMVIAEEFSDWEDSRRSIDLLALDRDANLVVIELKRTPDGGHMELQALRYAAMVSAMTFRQAVDAHAAYAARLGLVGDPQDRILTFLDWNEPDDDAFGQDVRLVLASHGFTKEITTAVLWFNERGIDIRCVRMVPYEAGGRQYLDVQQVIPLPEAEEYQVRVREKAVEERLARRGQSATQERNLSFWGALLTRAIKRTDLHAGISPSKDNWIARTAGGIEYAYAHAYGDGRAQVSLLRPNQDENKAIFDELYEHREDIESAFGGELYWQRLDEKIASRVAATVTEGSVRDETSWAEMHEAMIDAMIRLEAALQPHLERYRGGAVPGSAGAGSE